MYTMLRPELSKASAIATVLELAAPASSAFFYPIVGSILPKSQ
jgi:hypothetical protein